VDICTKAGGFNLTRTPTITEQALLTVLENAAKEIFANFFIGYPPCLIIENSSSVYNGTALMQKINTPKYNPHGHQIRYAIERIELKEALLVKEGFSKAFSTYCHELCHCFGGDASKSFSLALTDIMALTVVNINRLQQYNQEWLELFIT
jgi:hypothetical protein